MKTIKIDVPADMLKAAVLCAAKTDVRYYLNGVYIECINSVLRLVSTDGNALLVQRVQTLGNYNTEYLPDFSAIIPRDVLDIIGRTKKELKWLTPVTLEWLDDDNGTATVSITTAKGLTMSDKCIDGRFPDWRRVVPDTCSGEAAQYAPHLVARFANIGKVLRTGDYLHILHNGGSGAIVLLTDASMGVIIPFRAEAPDTNQAYILSTGTSD